MSEQVATEMSPGSARTIGDILLALGFVDEEGLAAAHERQRVTGQPIGQVLVEEGAITRLELATALAEQWADPSSPGPRWLDDPRAPSAPVPVSQLEPLSSPVANGEPSGLAPRLSALEAAVAELQDAGGGAYLSQLQEAVVELARRSAGSEAAAAELAERVEGSVAALARLRELDGEMTDVAQRLDAVAAGVEVAVHGLQGDLAGMAHSVSRLSTRVDEVALAAADAESLDRLRAALEELAARPAGDATVAAQLEEVLARVDELPAAAELEELRAAVAELARRPAADPGLEAALEELRAVVAEHAAQAHDPALAERVDALGQRLDDVAGDARGAAERVSRLGELEERLEGLAAELAQHDQGSARVGELAAAVSDLTGRVEALAAVAGAAVDADAVEALKAALDELAGRTATDPALASRIDALVEHVALLPDGHELQELRRSLDELLQRDHVVSELSARIEEVAARLDESPSRDAEEVVGAEVRELAGRVEEISRRLDEAAGEVVADLVRAPELAALRDSLDERLGGLDLLAARLDDLTTEIAARDREDERSGHDRAAALERVERLEQAVIELAQQRPENALADRVALLERSGAVADDLERIAGAVEIVRAEVHDRLASMAAELQGLDGRLDGLAARPALEPEAEARVAGVESRLEEVARSVAAGQASERRVAGSTLTGDTVEDIERLRMSIERLGHTIGEQGRAIAELMKMRGDNDALSRLTARIEALEDGGFAGGGTGDGAPPAGLGTLTRRVDDTDAALEKLLTQLERMGSSLEWRFRRLEEMVGGGG